jgi:hypothetical protein
MCENQFIQFAQEAKINIEKQLKINEQLYTSYDHEIKTHAHRNTERSQ